MKIQMILDKVDERQLFIPAFQREYVWKRDDVKQLMDSLLKEYPVGTMLTWETDNPPELRGTHKYEKSQGAVRILLDGQQRISSLYMLIRGTIPPYYAMNEITNDVSNLYVNVETGELSYYLKTLMEKNPRWCNITDIFMQKIRARDIVRELEMQGVPITREFDDLIDDKVNDIKNVLNIDFPEQTVPVKATIREAIDIFYKVNASGVSLTEAELALAQISGYWPQARELFKKKIADLTKNGFALSLNFIVYTLLGCIHYSGADLKKLHSKDNNEIIRKTWFRLENKILDYVINLIRHYAFIDHRDEINSVYALIPIIVYCYHLDNTPSEIEIKKMIKWFYYSQIRSRYVSQLQQKLEYDLRIIHDEDLPFDKLLSNISEERRLEIVPDEFVGHGVSHPLFSLMRWYFKSLNATCLSTGLPLRKNMGKSYQLENDHIFPYHHLKKLGYNKGGNRLKYALAQEMTNRAILTQQGNRGKSAMLPKEYLKGVYDSFPNALDRQCIPTDPYLWEMDQYENFLAARRKILADSLNEFLKNITETCEVSGKVTIEDLISQGENDTLEFKSSLRWDYKNGGQNKKLEGVIIKSVAALANADGGTLLIGINDDSEVLGLENDYTLLNADRDKFEIHLRNLLNENIGLVFTTSSIEILFPEVSGIEICQVEIQPAQKPIIIKHKNNSGLIEERFYVRSGNSSQIVPMSELNEYWSSRFS